MSTSIILIILIVIIGLYVFITNKSNKEEKDYNEIAHIKGLYSFVLSIEKNGVENGYSDKMKSLLVERGYETLKQLLSSLGNDELNKNEIDDLGSH